MDNNLHKTILLKSSAGYAYCKMIFDDERRPVDYVFLEANPAYENITGLDTTGIIGHRATEVIPDILNSDFDFIGFYGNIAVSNGFRQYRQYSHSLKRWYKVQVYAPEPDHFVTLYLDITAELEESGRETLEAASPPELDEARQRYQEASEENGKLRERIGELERQHQEAQQQKKAELSECTEARQRYQEASEENGKLRQRYQEASEENGKLRERIGELERQHQEAQQQKKAELSECTEARQRYQEASEENEKLRQRYQEASEENEKLRQRYQEASEENGKLCERIVELERQHQEAQNANTEDAEKIEFLADICNEMCTLLKSTINSVDLLLGTRLNSEQQALAFDANSAAQALMGIVRDILDFSSMEMDTLKLSEDNTCIYHLVEQAVDDVRHDASTKGLELLVDVQPDIPDFFFVDALRMKQVLVNLLSNCVGLTEKGEVELRVRFDRDPFDTQWGNFEFSFCDTGTEGNMEEQKDMLDSFSRNFRANRKMACKYGGTGLGLALSGKLLQMMNSELKIDSQGVPGSRYCFELKCRCEESKEQQSVIVAGISRAIVVDDIPAACDIMKRRLEYLRIQTDIAGNALEAMSIIEKNGPYDLILVDNHMPYIDGVETISLIRKKLLSDARKLPEIILLDSFNSAVMADEDVMPCEEFAIRLIKPVKQKELLECLQRIATGGIMPSEGESPDTSNNSAPEAECNIGDRPEENPSNWATELKDTLEVQDRLDLSEKTCKILVAEDVPVNMMLMQSALLRILPKATIIQAVDGQEAVDKTLSLEPDMILMDIQMPVRNGYDAAREIRKAEIDRVISGSQDGISAVEGDSTANKTGNVPIIALTAGVVKGERSRCMEAGMDDYLTKPVDVDELEAMLRRYLWNDTRT